MSSNKILLDNEHVTVELENGILISIWKSSFVDLTIAKQVVKERLEVDPNKKYPALIKIKAIKESTKEARDFLASEEGCSGLSAGAICVNSILENVIATLFIYLNKPIIPTKVFSDEQKAKEWLSGYL